MRIPILIAVVAVVMSYVSPLVQGATLFKEDITIVGTLSQEPVLPSTPARKLPFTIKNVFTILGISGIDPRSQTYYYDGTNNAIVIAAKSIGDGGEGTPTVVVFLHPTAMGADYKEWDYNEWDQNEKVKVAGGRTTALNGGLRVGYTLKAKTKQGFVTETINFLGYGTTPLGRKTVASIKIIQKYSSKQ